MPLTVDPLDILRLHHSWATRLVVDRCATLSDDELHRRFPIGPGSVHDTLLHILGAIRYWHDRLRGVAVRPPVDPSPLGQPQPRRSLAELGMLYAESDRELARLAEDLRAGRVEPVLLSRQPPGKQFTAVITYMHMFTHGVHHRAQVLNMLRQIRPTESTLDLDLPDWQVLEENTV